MVEVGPRSAVLYWVAEEVLSNKVTQEHRHERNE